MSLASLKPNLKTAQIASGRTYEYLDVPAVGDKTKGTLLLLHGFPDSWFGWRKQIQPWANRGFRIIAPSALGYGGTDKPTDPAEYTWKKLADDIDALLDVVVGKDEKVFIVSHDWGAFTGWRYTQWHGDRVKAFCSVSIPFIPAPAPGTPYYPIEVIAQKMPALSYQVYFNEPTADKDLDNNRERFLDVLYQTPENLMKAGLGQPGGFKKAVQGSDPVEKSPFWNDEERAFYNDYFKAGGFKAPLQFYQSNKPKHEEETTTPPPDLPEGVPKLFVHPTYDSVAIPHLVEKTGEIPNTTIVRVEKAGHWLLQGPEAAEVESKVGDWLESVAAGAKL